MSNYELTMIGMFLMGMVASALLFLVVQMVVSFFTVQNHDKRKRGDIEQ